MKLSNPEFLAKAKQLSKDQQERLLSRMEGKLPKRLHKDKISREEAIAIQLELEEEQLEEWREKMREIKQKAEESKKKEAAKNVEKTAKNKTDKEPSVKKVAKPSAVKEKVAKTKEKTTTKPEVVKAKPLVKTKPAANAAVTKKTPAKP